MTRRKAPSRRLPPSKPRRFVIAGLACGAVLAAILGAEYTLTRLQAHALALDQWKAGPGDEVILRPAADGPVLSIEGTDREGMDVYFSKATLDTGTTQKLQTLGLELPGADEAIAWRSVYPEVSGHTMADITLLSPQTGAEVRFASTAEGPNAAIRVTVRHATLLVKLAVLQGDMSPSAASEQKGLDWANGHRVLLPGVFKVAVHVKDGAYLLLVFPVREPHSDLYLGNFDKFDKLHAPRRRLAVREVGVRPTDAEVYRTYACAAPADEIWWRQGEPAGDACATTPRLFADKLRIASDALVLTVEGTAYVAKDGDFDHWVGYAWMGKNPIIVAIFGPLVAGLVGWAALSLKGAFTRKK